MSRIRVVVVIHGYFPRVGGAERQMQYLAARLMERGIDLHILTRRYDRQLKADELVDGVPVHRLPVPGPKAIASLIFTGHALRLIARLRPQLVHAHEFISPATVALLAERWLHTPFLVTPHLSGPNGDVHKLLRKSSGQMRLEALRSRSKGFIVISREIEEELKNVGISADRQTMIPNGVDMQQFAPPTLEEKDNLRRSLGLTPDSLVAIFTGRLAPVKRVDHLIQTWQKIRENYHTAELLLVGAGPEEARLRSMAGQGVHFLGSRNDVAQCLRAADIFVLPSSAEGLSVAMLEAMSCGLPAVLTDVGGAREVIVHKENGWLISPTSGDDLEVALRTLLGDAQLRSRLGNAGRQRVGQAYSIDTAADKLFELYLKSAGEMQS